MELSGRNLLSTDADSDVESPPADYGQPGGCTVFKLVLLYVCIWLSLAAFMVFMWYIGVLQSVIGNLLTYPVLACLALLLLMTILPCVLRKLADLWWKFTRIPAYVRRKLWELPPAVLPMFETMMKGLLEEMEERILKKLAEMPRDVAHAVTHMSHAAKDAAHEAGSAAKAAAPSSHHKAG